MLQLDDLFQLFEEVEVSKNINEDLTANAELVLKLLIPKIQITGKTIGNQEVLNKFVKGVAGTTVGEKLNQLSITLTQAGKIDKRGKNLSLLTEKIAILDALAKMFNEFEASPAGFLNETFISAFFPGGQKIDATEANEQNLITDVRGDKEYSIKTISKGSVVGGSAYNLCNTVHQHQAVTYLVFEKQFVKSEKGEKTTTAFVMYEYVVTKDNLSSIPLLKGGNAGDYYAEYENTFSLPPKEKGRDIVKRTFKINRSLYTSQKEPVVVNFSTEQALEELAEVVSDSIQKIKELHQEMQTLSMAMSKYFTSQNENEKRQLGQQMMGASKEVDPKTKEIAK